MKRAVIGIDVGGTKALCLLVDERFRVLEAIKFRTAPQRGRTRFTRRLLGATQALKGRAAGKNFKIVAVGAACAGQIDPKKLMILRAKSLTSMEAAQQVIKQNTN